MLGNPKSRRVREFTETAYRLGVPARVVSYSDFFAERCNSLPAGSLVRIESPAECLSTMQEILRAGIPPMEVDGLTPVSASQVGRLAPQRGEMVHPRQWFYGYRAVLGDVWKRWNSSDVAWMSTPGVIAVTFDKVACLQRWANAELPIPAQLPLANGYDAIRAAFPQRHARLFVKLRYGYSAMGAVALEWRDTEVRAITTVEVCRHDNGLRLFVSKSPRILHTEREIAWLIDMLAKEEVLVESWLPKDRWRGRSYDLRIVTIDGRASHVVGRASDSPFTNLNLDARRISQENVRLRLGENWQLLMQLASRAADCFPDAEVLGIDVIVQPGGRQFRLLEANGFGDYLPGLLSQGQSVYEAELRGIVSRRAAA